MKRKCLSILLFLFSLNAFSQGLVVDHLKCEYKLNPLGIESIFTKLSWQLKSNQRSVLQTSFRILVSDDPNLLEKNIGNTWDSKKVISDQSVQVKYVGQKLLAAKTYWWKVMVWDNKHRSSGWSRVAQWQMGLITRDDWTNAEWIAYDKIPDTLVNILPTDGKKDTYTGNNVMPLLRKSFQIMKPVKKATMFICGLGHFDLSINGKKIEDHFLDPGWTKYDKQALYVPFDVTKNLKRGENAVGVMLGNGFYYIPPVSGRYRKLKVAFGYPKMICRLVVEYSDGSIENIVSDRSWKTSAGPITFSSIYGGEDYDARLEQKGWDEPTFQASSWKNVVVVNGPPVLNAQMAESLKIMDSFSIKNKYPISSNSWVFDLGQNASGIVRIKVAGKKGDTIRILPAELLKADSSISQRPSGSPYYWQYILKGEGIETFQPRFTYYGFRHVQINGAVPKDEKNPSRSPFLIELKGLHTSNSAGNVGSFSSSNQLLDQTYKLIDWALRSNTASLFTDCPHREKLGWLEEAHLMGNSIRYNYDVVNLYRKQVQDMKYSQTEQGLVPEIAPEYVKFEWGDGMFRDSPEWGSNAIITPWDLYRWYGDKEILESSYEMMKRYIDYLQTKAKGHILSQGLGDWYDLGPKPPGVSQLTPMGVTGTAIYYLDLNIISDAATLLNKEEDATGYKKLAAEVKKAFNDTFFNKNTKQYGTGSQTANAMAVYMGLVEPEYKEAVIENIVADISNRGYALTAGDIGYHYLLSVLNEAGRDDVIFYMNSRTDVPGYGYQLAKGATALTESWQALPTVSNNHFMLGHLMEWFFCGLGGIRQSDSSVAFKNLIIDPRPVKDLAKAKVRFDSPYGVISSDWKKQEGSFDIKIEIPPNTTATLYLPATNASVVTENNLTITNNPNIRFVGYQNGKSIFNLGSGSYQFMVKNKSVNQ